MAITLKRSCRLSRIIHILLLVLLFQLGFFLTRKALDVFGNKEFHLVSLNESFTEYQFINNHFSSASEGSWQNVSESTETGKKFLAFSAFLDNRSENPFVSVIAVASTKKKFRKDVWCKFWYTNLQGNYYSATISGNYKLLSEHWGLAYSGYYVQCPIDKELPIPNAISLLTDPNEVPENMFKVIVNYSKQKAKEDLFDIPSTLRNMAVCVKPLHYEYNQVMEIIQFIELHQIMGVSQFFFYNHTVGPQVNCLLNDYIKEGIVTILPWELPIVSQKEIRTEGIFAALNDCLYRTMHVYSHTLFIDFDEYILPRNNYTYNEFFEYLNLKNDIKSNAAFIFQNAFFYRQWPDDLEVNNFNDPLAANLLILKKTRRKKALHPHRTRSKYIVRPERVNMVGNHFIWEYHDKKFKPMNIKPEDGILHHYRICEFGGDDCVKQESVVDRTAYKYKDDLVRAVRRRLEEHRTECQLNDFIY